MKKLFLSKKAFSLIELIISLIIVSLVVAVFTSVITKKLKNQAVAINSAYQTTCSKFGSECKMCKGKEKCLVCTKKCASNEYLDTTNCSCKNCSNFGSCTSCTSTSCIASGCENGILNGNSCSACPTGYYCHNGAKIHCSTFGIKCSSCNANGCLSCKDGHLLQNKRCVAPVEVRCSDFDPYCSSCNNSSCTGCKSGYLKDGKCIQNCEAFGPGCRLCNASGCSFCNSGFKIKNYNGKNYCVLKFSRPAISWGDVNHIYYYNLAPRLEFYGDTSQKCSSPNAPCCWHYNSGVDSTIVCNFLGALSVCGTGHLGYSRLADSFTLNEYVRYLNNHQDTSAGITGSGADGDIVHTLVYLSMISEYKMCRNNTTTDGAWCMQLNDKCCYSDSSIPCVCVPFGLFGSEYGSIMTLNSQTATIGEYPPTAAARIMCFQ